MVLYNMIYWLHIIVGEEYITNVQSWPNLAPDGIQSFMFQFASSVLLKSRQSL